SERDGPPGDPAPEPQRQVRARDARQRQQRAIHGYASLRLEHGTMHLPARGTQQRFEVVLQDGTRVAPGHRTIGGLGHGFVLLSETTSHVRAATTLLVRWS